MSGTRAHGHIYGPVAFHATQVRGRLVQARRASLVVNVVQGGGLSPLLGGWWPEVAVAPPVHGERSESQVCEAASGQV